MQTSQSAPLFIRRVAVCGAGVMGAQIAAHCVNAGVPVVLFDLAKDDGQGGKNGIVQRAIAQLKKLNPAPLGVDALADLITPANYDEDLALLPDAHRRARPPGRLVAPAALASRVSRPDGIPSMKSSTSPCVTPTSPRFVFLTMTLTVTGSDAVAGFGETVSVVDVA